MKKLNIILVILSLLLLVGCQAKDTILTKNIVKAIDNEGGENGTCQIRMKDVTNFKWDKMVMYGLSSSNEEVSKALGVAYDVPTDLVSGLVFAYNHKIVGEEIVPYYPEYPNRLQYWTRGESTSFCLSFTPDNAIFEGSREKREKKDDIGNAGDYYYVMTAITK